MKKIFSGLAAAALALSLASGAFAQSDAAQLSDVSPGSWFYEPVSEMVASGVITGYEDGSFRPDQTVTAVELVTMVARIIGAPSGESGGFWGGLQMDHAYRSGWISEEDVPRGEYSAPVSRELACKLLSSAVGVGYPAGTILPFSDAGSIAPGYVGGVMALYSHGIITGFEDGAFHPQSTLTRAQAAALLYRAVNLDQDGAPGAGEIYAAGYTAGQILDHFCTVALGAEYGDSADAVIRWAEPLLYYIEGAATDADLAKFGAIADALNSVPGFPGLSEAGSAGEANLRIRFVDSEGMAEISEDVDPGSAFNGYVTIWWQDYEISRGDIYYNTDIPQSERDGVIVEELCQSLGLLTDTYDYPESVFYQYHTDAAWPSTLDWAIIQLLYRSELAPGMDEDAVRAAAASIVR